MLRKLLLIAAVAGVSALPLAAQDDASQQTPDSSTQNSGNYTERAGKADRAEQARLRTEQQAAQRRERLRQQLSQVLQTRETAQGLVANLPDVLFDFNKATLKKKPN